MCNHPRPLKSVVAARLARRLAAAAMVACSPAAMSATAAVSWWRRFAVATSSLRGCFAASGMKVVCGGTAVGGTAVSAAGGADFGGIGTNFVCSADLCWML